MIFYSKSRIISYIAIAAFIIAILIFPGVIPRSANAARSAFSIIEAESFNSKYGNNLKIININPNGSGIGYIESGNYVVYNDLDFGTSGVASFKARVATQKNLTIQIKTGSSNGTLIGTLNVSSTGNFDNYTELSCGVSNITGINNICLVFSDAVNIDWFTFIPSASVPQTPTPTATAASSGTLKVEVSNGNTNSSIGSISVNFKITNTGSQSINLSTVKLRYYYTLEGATSQAFQCNYSTVGSANVTGSFYSLGQTSANADSYLEIGFTGAANTLAPGNSIDVQTQFNKSNWTNYTQTNDYSFTSSTNYVVWNKVTAYINNTLVWGIEPTSSGSTQPPVNTPIITATPAPTPVATAAPTIPAGTSIRIEAENHNNIKGNTIQNITIPYGGYGLGYINNGDFAAYYNVNFGQGFSLFKAKVAAARSTGIEIRIGSENGNCIGYLSIPSTGGWDNYQEFSCNISNAVNGYNNIYLVFRESVNIDWFEFSGTSGTYSTPVPTATPVPNERNAFVEIQAEHYNSTNAKYIQTIGISDGGSAVGYLLSGDYIVFHNVNFIGESNSFKARVATENATSMEIRTGSPSGDILGVVNISSTGGWYNFQDITCTTKNISGTHTLYFVFNGPINFDWFVFLPKSSATTIDAFSTIQAESYTGISSTSIKKVGGVICYIQSGNYIVFNNVDFKDGAKSFKAYVVNGSGSTTDIEIRLGSSTGTLLGTLSVPSISNWDDFQELSCNINTVTGKNNLYLVFNGPVNVDWFTFMKDPVIQQSTPTPTTSPTPTASTAPTATTTPSVSATPAASTTPVVSATPTMVIPTPVNITLDQPNLHLVRTGPQRAELASLQTISSTQDGELTLSGLGTIQGEKEVLLLVDNALSNGYAPINTITPLDYAIFANNNLRGVGDNARVKGNVHANNKLESYIADLNVAGVVSASTISIGYGSNFDGELSIIDSPLPMPKFHDNIISEITDENYKFYPSEFPDSTDRQFPNQPGFHIRYEHNNNTFVITGAGTFNLESSMYFDGNLRISVPHIINTNSNFLVAEGFISLEGHNVNPAELDETSIQNTTNILNIYSIHGRIFITTSSSKIYGVLYAAGEEDPTGKYTNDVGVVVMQGINTDVYGSIIAGSDVRLEGSSSRYFYVSEISTKVEKKYLPTASALSAKEAAQQIVDMFDGTNTRMYAMQFSDKAYVNMDSFKFYNLSSHANETAELRSLINSFPENETGLSNMGDALRRGKELLTHPTKSSPDATKYIIILAANAPNKWTSSIDQATGEAIGIEGSGTADPDENAVNYAVDMAASLVNSGIKAAFVDNSPKDISESIERIAVASGAPAINGDKHYYSSALMADYSPVYTFIITDPPTNAVIKNAVYTEIFPEGIQLVDIPSEYHLEKVEGNKREKLTIDNLNIKLTYDGTKYIVEPFTIEVKIRPRKIGNITFSGNDSKIIYSIEYIDLDGNARIATFEKHFNDFTLNVYMSIDIG